MGGAAETVEMSKVVERRGEGEQAKGGSAGEWRAREDAGGGEAGGGRDQGRGSVARGERGTRGESGRVEGAAGPAGGRGPSRPGGYYPRHEGRLRDHEFWPDFRGPDRDRLQ